MSLNGWKGRSERTCLASPPVALEGALGWGAVSEDGRIDQEVMKGVIPVKCRKDRRGEDVSGDGIMLEPTEIIKDYMLKAKAGEVEGKFYL